jgi:hypothetical protein
MKIRVMVAALGFVGGLPFISTNLFAGEVPPTRVPVGSPVLFTPENYSLPHAAVSAGRPQSAGNRGVQISLSYDGIDFSGSNCDCWPPDTNAAVSNGFVVETVNVWLRVFDKNTGIVLVDEPLAILFRAPSGGDPYVVYDDIAERWYISAFDSNDLGLFLAVSADGKPLHGFQTLQGFQSVINLYLVKRYNITPLDINTGTAPVTQEKVAKVIAISTRNSCRLIMHFMPASRLDEPFAPHPLLPVEGRTGKVVPGFRRNSHDRTEAILSSLRR